MVIWLIIIISVPVVLVMIMNLSFAIWESERQHKLKQAKLKAELEDLAIKKSAKLSYGEKQRLNFALGKHWKR